ncbi:plasmid partitioning protein RepB C-terminal domain-containing protein [Bradyrhizobium elkanii]|uniref:plasmid partitioning protein RepB C-terminal domain-containing protein n=1 Tax=Bradyrhizobium elkanii TaxID=29448 RepID=UPI0020A160CF|nr:plasmid partitioning protein RepB C-terminal domain-containing protein [Bradyrhizobium elkanii]MCP1973894.1 ParB family chromosome partitioning protein [Bradyrhizobium elkanii]MCS4104601.1 ParB family chromosome partitioning protein [Bradyrhizobium elkanii]
MGSVQSIEMVPIGAIDVVNPRARNRRVFKEIVTSVAELGLKRPITVKRKAGDGEQRYDLVCGQGRLEAYQALGQREIPAIVIDATNEDSAIMSLVENCARRQHRSIDLLHDIDGLRHRGYEFDDIACKTGLTVEYVRGVSNLLENGEQRLLRAVEAGQLPVSIAVLISQAEDNDVQNVLQHAYEEKLLRGQRLLAAKKLIEQRRRRGKGYKTGPRRTDDAPISSNALLRAYRQDVDRKRVLVRKSNNTKARLVFILEALRKLLTEPDFLAILEGEKLDTLPKNLAVRLNGPG